MRIDFNLDQKIDLKEFRSFINYCGIKLCLDDIDVIIEENPKLLDTDGVYAYSADLGEDFYEIEIDTSIKKRLIYETVAHELVHIKQYHFNELEEHHDCYIWQGNVISKDIEYWERPWEIEAHGRQLGLFLRWAEEINLTEAWARIEER